MCTRVHFHPHTHTHTHTKKTKSNNKQKKHAVRDPFKKTGLPFQINVQQKRNKKPKASSTHTHTHTHTHTQSEQKKSRNNRAINQSVRFFFVRATKPDDSSASSSGTARASVVGSRACVTRVVSSSFVPGFYRVFSFFFLLVLFWFYNEWTRVFVPGVAVFYVMNELH